MKKDFSIIGIGDVMLQYPIFAGRKAKKESIQKVSSVIRRADFVFANLEVTLSEKGYPREKLITLKALPHLADDIARLGIQGVGLANNHALDFGFEGLFETMKALNGAGIRYVGAGKNLDEASKPLITKIGKTRIGFLAYSSTLPLGGAAGRERPGIAPVHIETLYLIEPTRLQEQPGTPPRVRTTPAKEDAERLKKEVASLREKVDVMLVSFHWGVAFQDEIADYQRLLSHSLIDEGVDAILGHHPHRIQEIEVYKGRLICYSLGDFMFQYTGLLSEKMSPESFMARFVIAGNKIREVELIPVILDKEGNPQIASKADKDRILERIRKLSPSVDRCFVRRKSGSFLIPSGGA